MTKEQKIWLKKFLKDWDNPNEHVSIENAMQASYLMSRQWVDKKKKVKNEIQTRRSS
jgi:hypothetical protein